MGHNISPVGIPRERIAEIADRGSLSRWMWVTIFASPIIDPASAGMMMFLKSVDQYSEVSNFIFIFQKL
jgi:hypothetical protein